MGKIKVGCTETTAFIEVEGRGVFQDSPCLKRFILFMAERGLKKFTLTLKTCVGMDSTFMGTLTWLALKLKREFHSRLKLINVSSHNVELLETLGIIKYLDVGKEEKEESVQLKSLRPETQDRVSLANHMLEAHKTLMKIEEKNVIKFKDVERFLEEDIRRMTNKKQK